MRWTQSLFSSRKTRVLGLDISSSAVKLLELTRSGDCCCVQNFGKEILPEQVMSGHVVQDIPALAQAIQSLLFKLDISSRTDVALQAVIAVPDACTITRTIQVSECLADQDLEELALSELTQCIPDALEELYYDFKRLSHVVQPGIYPLLIMAARAQYVRDRVAAARQIGLAVTVVDIESLALQRMLPFILPQTKRYGITAILDLGARFFKVFFFRQDSLLFMHAEEFGVLALPSGLHENMYQVGILQMYQRACHFLSAEYPQREPVSHLILSGGGVLRQPDLVDWLQQQCELLVYRADPFAQMRVAEGCDLQQLQYEAPLYLTACGLAKRV
jgi:type IV pilus assembly protein PilM